MSVKLKKVLYSPTTTVGTSSALRFKMGIIPESVRLLQANYPGTYHFGPYGNPALNDYVAGLPFGRYLALRHYLDTTVSFPAPYSWANWRTNPNNLYIEVDQAHSGTTGSVPARVIEYLEVQNSSITVGWPGPKGTRVGGLMLSKTKPPTNRPKEPVYRKPRLLVARKPVRRPPVSLRMNPPNQLSGEGRGPYQARLNTWLFRKSRKEEKLTLLADRKYFQQLAKYKVVNLVNEKRILKSKETFKEVTLKYQKRLLKYEELVRKSKELTYKRAPIHPEGIPQDNPYGLIKMTFREVPTFLQFVSGDDSIYLTQDNINVASYYNMNPSSQEWYDLFNTFFVVYGTSALTDKTPVADLAQYGEGIRNMILSTIDPYLVDIDNKLKRKIHQKLKNQTVHIGNIIAERKQTMDLVQSSVKRILQLIKAKKNIFKAAASYAKNAKQIASDILAFKFGVEPLMNDIQSFAKYLDTGVDEPIVTVRANTGKANAIPLKVETGSFTFVGFVEISYTVKCVVDNPAGRALSEFGLINPLEILWEVTPWSFVVDWFFPVGDWLSNKTSDFGLTFKTGTRKVKLVGTFTTEGSQNGLPPGSVSGTDANSALVDFDGEVIGRTVLTAIPNLPAIKLKNPLSWSHGVESVALAVQKLKIRR